MADATLTPIQTTPGTTGGSLSGTMANPTPTPAQPTLTPPPQPNATPPQNTGASNQFGLSQVMGALEEKTKANNALMTQRNLILKHLYDQPLTPEEQAKLDPTLLPAIKGNDRNQLDMSLRLIGDEIAGRTGTLDQSVQYLTQAYNDQIKNAETARQDAISNVSDFVKQYGSNAGTALKSLYGQQYVDQLKGMGINVDTFSGIPTLAQITSGVTITPTLGDSVGKILGLPSYNTKASNPTLNRPTRNNNPGDIKVSEFSKSLPGVVGVESGTAADGGNFLIFDSPQAGLNAIGMLLQKGKSYQGVTADQAMKKYSGGGYGATAVGLDPKGDFQTQISDPATLDAVTQAIAAREGFAGTGGNVGGLTPAAIDLAANQYLATGTMPSLGQGSSVATQLKRTAILNRAAELGQGNIPAVNKAQLSALTGSLKDQTDFLNNVQRALNGAELGAQKTQELFKNKNINPNSSTFANTKLNDLTKQFGDSGDIRAYQAAMTEIGNEYAQVFARGGQRSVEGNAIAQDLVNGNIKLADIQKTFDTLQEIGKTVVSTAQSQVDQIQGQMSNLLTGKATTPTTTGDLAAQVKAKGYDYDKLHADGHSDADIKAALGL